MKNLTDRLVEMDGMLPLHSKALEWGAAVARGDKTFRPDLDTSRSILAEIRADFGFYKYHAPILTKPNDNLKLAKGEVPAYGITLQHHVVKTHAAGVVNLCPNAGDCTKVCVLNGGSGGFDAVQRARRWKTELLATNPIAFMTVLGWEIERAVQKHGRIYLRPNVNSDLQWERIVPALVDGSIWGDAVTLYGYTKLTEYLDGNGWVTPHYRVAYSWNERSPRQGQVGSFLQRGGSVAVVTDRKVAIGFREAQPFDAEVLRRWVRPYDPQVVDADLSDEWIFQASTIGDLAAKGKAMKLVGKSDFIVNVYNNNQESN